MKLKISHIFLFFLAVTIAWTSCKKSEIKTNPVTKVNTDAVAKQIALNLYKSLIGKMGGTNINDGIKAPLSISPSRNGKTLNSLTTLCGYVIDTAWNSSTTSNDTNRWVSSKFIFVYTCGNDKVDGYNAYDSIRVDDQNSKFVNSYTNVQQYIVKAISDDFKLVSADGNIKTIVSSSVYATPSAVGVYHTINCQYYLQGLHIDLSGTSGDIQAGTATFVTSTRDITADTGTDGVKANYTGKITFLPNHMGKLTIDPEHDYSVNFLTGVVTAL